MTPFFTANPKINQKTTRSSDFSPAREADLPFPNRNQMENRPLSIVRIRQTKFKFSVIMRLRFERGKYAGKDRNLLRR